MNNFINNLNSGSKDYVGVSLNANGLLEVAVTSHANKRVQKYTNRRISYNIVSRQIDDTNALTNELENAFNELNLNPKNCNVSFSVPNVLFAITQLPEILSEDEIREALASKIMDSYLFKNTDANISWQVISRGDDGSMKVAYSAIQEQALLDIKDAINEQMGLNANLISVQSSYSTMFEALDFSGIIDDRMLTNGPNTVWNALVISASSYAIFNFVGKELNDYFEEPLTIKFYTPEEVNEAVASMAASYLQNFPAENLLVISETDDISAAVLSSQLGFTGHCEYIEQNKYSQTPVIEVDLDVIPEYAFQITTTAIGASIDHFAQGLFKFNYIKSDTSYDTGDLLTFGDKTIEMTTQKALKIAAVFAVVVMLIFGTVAALVNDIIKKQEAQIVELEQKEKTLTEEKNNLQIKEPTIDISDTVDTIVKANRKKMLYYDALSYGIPEKLWIEYFYVGPENAIAINGVAQKHNDITLFLKGIKEVAGEAGVSLSKLSMTGDDNIIGGGSGPDLYSFSLTSPNYVSSSEAKKSDQEGEGQEDQPVEPNPAPQQNEIPPASTPSVAPPVIPTE